jgi:hypothetical protein
MDSSENLLRQRGVQLGLGVLALASLIWLAQFFLAPPQIGPDETVFQTVDALFTALTTKDLTRVEDCERRLREAQAAGTLPAPAAARLEGVIGQAREGEWEPAAKRLYDFMLGQRGN